jgi:hypothetical protein
LEQYRAGTVYRPTAVVCQSAGKAGKEQLGTMPLPEMEPTFTSVEGADNLRDLRVFV